MNYQMLAAFALGMFLLAASPGPGVIGSMTKAAAEGFKAALYFIGGLVIGDSLFFFTGIVRHFCYIKGYGRAILCS